jgi:acid stress-induced BolA-like protein IbaG/YrbA
MKIHDYFVKLNRIRERYKDDLNNLNKVYGTGPSLKEKLEYILKRAMSTNDVQINEHHDGYISGYVISESFGKESDEIRMKRIWNHLNNFLFEEEIKKILYLTTYTRKEWREEK